MAFQTGLEGKPWYFGLIAGLVVGGVVYFGAHKLLLKPKKDAIGGLESQLTGLQAKIQEGRAAQQQLPRFREEVRQLELELDKLLRILPARRNTPELMRRIRTLAEQGDFNLLRFTPGAFIEQDFYSEWPIAINLEATYHNLAQFFERVSRFSRIINIEDLQVGALTSNPDHTISASFRAKTFVYKEEDDEADEGSAP
ncbi:MAG: type 4a pilus biogenesis protein PilO [bacterium]|nr:type 4a pilus biogenesis protein PilO [bacterium]